MENKEYKIYKLVLDGEVVYVGITTYKKLSQRKNRHNCADTFERVRESEIELIEITTDKSRERYWIQHHLDKGCKLFNITKGNGFKLQEYYKENKKSWKKYYKKNKEERIEYQKIYQKENKDKINQYNREYYERKKEEKRIYYKKYREQNKQKLKEQEKKRKAKKI
jgi:hypothetical protein